MTVVTKLCSGLCSSQSVDDSDAGHAHRRPLHLVEPDGPDGLQLQLEVAQGQAELLVNLARKERGADGIASEAGEDVVSKRGPSEGPSGV